jgi:hypothetical protein
MHKIYVLIILHNYLLFRNKMQIINMLLKHLHIKLLIYVIIILKKVKLFIILFIGNQVKFGKLKKFDLDL